MQTLRSLASVVNIKSVLISALAFASTLFCLYFITLGQFEVRLSRF